jgi:hypothetical protein
MESSPNLARANANAYSARTLCHTVLVPLAAELGFNIGVTGREPLNNKPYLRMTRLGDDTPVHQGGRAPFLFMLELVEELASARLRSSTFAEPCEHSSRCVAPTSPNIVRELATN